MRARLWRAALLTKSLAFTIAIHAALIALLFVSFNWAGAPTKRGGDEASAEPIAAVVIDEDEINALAEAKRKEEERKAAEAKRAAEQLAETKRKQKEAEEQLRKTEEAQRKREEEERAAQARKKEREEQERREAEAKKKREAEAKRKREAEAKRKREAEENKKREEEAKRKAAEEKRKRETEEKRKREELQRKLEAEEQKKREAEAKRKREAEAKRKAEQERKARIKTDAASALSALVDRIAAQVEDNWRRPATSSKGLVAVIRVKVARDGRVLSAAITRSSGDELFDVSAERAVHSASPLPFPDNPEYYEHINEFDFKFSPDR